MRASTTFVAMMVLNPVIILFYQNCSVVPARSAAVDSPPVATVEARKPSAQAENPQSFQASGCGNEHSDCRLQKME